MQYKVPQNVTMEDKIVGPLTAIQFGIVIMGGGMAFLVYSSASVPPPLNQFFGVIIALLTAVISMGKFNDQPIYRFLKFFFAYLITPKTRVWHKTGKSVELIKPSDKKIEQEKQTPTKIVSKSDINKLAELIDTKGKSGYAPKINTSETTELKKK